MIVSKKPRVFIGSSVESLDIARAIEEQLEHVADVNIWKDDIFLPGESGLESLCNVVISYDFGIFVFSADDVTKTRSVTHSTPRDNVVFELGLFMGRLGRRRTFAVLDRTINLKLPSDLTGIANLTFARKPNLTSALSPVGSRIIKEIERQGSLERSPLDVFEGTTFAEILKWREAYMGTKSKLSYYLIENRCSVDDLRHDFNDLPLPILSQMLTELVEEHKIKRWILESSVVYEKESWR